MATHHSATAATPRLTVILAVRAPGDSPDAVLSALSSEPGIARCEVILVDGRPSFDDPASAEASGHRVAVHALPGAAVPALKAFGARRAAGAWLAFLEPKGVPLAGWLDAALTATAGDPRAVLGGPVDYAGSGTGADQAAFLFEYGAFGEAAASSGSVADLPGNNMVLPRAALFGECGEILDRIGLNKPFCQARLTDAGYPVRWVPSMRVAMRTAHRTGPLLASRFHHARCFGGLRAARSAPMRRWLYRLAGGMTVLLLLRRHTGRWRRGGVSGKSLETLAALVSLCWVWACGEWLGSLGGPGASCARVY